MRKIPKSQIQQKLKMSKIPEPKFSNQAQTSPDSPFPSEKRSELARSNRRKTKTPRSERHYDPYISSQTKHSTHKRRARRADPQFPF